MPGGLARCAGRRLVAATIAAEFVVVAHATVLELRPTESTELSAKSVRVSDRITDRSDTLATRLQWCASHSRPGIR